MDRQPIGRDDKLLALDGCLVERRKANKTVVLNHKSDKTIRRLKEKIEKHTLRNGLISIPVTPAIHSEDKSPRRTNPEDIHGGEPSHDPVT